MACGGNDGRAVDEAHDVSKSIRACLVVSLKDTDNKNLIHVSAVKSIFTTNLALSQPNPQHLVGSIVIIVRCSHPIPPHNKLHNISLHHPHVQAVFSETCPYNHPPSAQQTKFTTLPTMPQATFPFALTYSTAHYTKLRACESSK